MISPLLTACNDVTRDDDDVTRDRRLRFHRKRAAGTLEGVREPLNRLCLSAVERGLGSTALVAASQPQVRGCRPIEEKDS